MTVATVRTPIYATGQTPFVSVLSDQSRWRASSKKGDRTVAVTHKYPRKPVRLTALQYYLVSWCARRYRQSRNAIGDLLAVAEMLQLTTSQTALVVIDHLPPSYRNRYARYVLETYSNYPRPTPSVNQCSQSDPSLSVTIQNIMRYSPAHSPV